MNARDENHEFAKGCESQNAEHVTSETVKEAKVANAIFFVDSSNSAVGCGQTWLRCQAMKLGM